MRPRARRYLALSLALVHSWIALWSSTAYGATDFSAIDPILKSRCILCHSGAAAPLALRLDSREGLLAGSSGGAVVVAGDPAASELVRRLKGESLPRMPMTGPPYLSDEEVALFEQWILAGMPAGDESQVQAGTQSLDDVSGPVGYDRVAVIFAQRCVKCHTEQGLMGGPPEGYRLGSYADTLSTSDRVRVVPDNAAASELVRRIRGQARPRMPYDGPPFLAGDEIALIEEWINDGARDSAGTPAPVPAGSRVRLHGTLVSSSMLDDLPIVITRSTRIDKSPRPGNYVELRGTVAADGHIIVERLRPRE